MASCEGPRRIPPGRCGRGLDIRSVINVQRHSDHRPGLPIQPLVVERTSPSSQLRASTRPAIRPRRKDPSRLALSRLLKVVLHFLHAELTNHCNACLHFCFSDQQLMTVMTPYPSSYTSSRPELCCARTQSHSNIISHGVQTASHTDIPSRPASVISKPLPPHTRGTSGRQRASKQFFLFCIEGF